MKQGSTDDPFAEAPEEDEQTQPADEEQVDEEVEPTPTDQREDAPPTTETTPGTPDETRPGRGQRRSLPYIHSRDGVKDGRTQRPVFLRDHIEDGIDELVDRMEGELGEDVYKTDVTEAAMAVAEENPELVLAKLEEWGYGWE